MSPRCQLASSWRTLDNAKELELLLAGAGEPWDLLATRRTWII